LRDNQEIKYQLVTDVANAK